MWPFKADVVNNEIVSYIQSWMLKNANYLKTDSPSRFSFAQFEIKEKVVFLGFFRDEINIRKVSGNETKEIILAGITSQEIVLLKLTLQAMRKNQLKPPQPSLYEAIKSILED